MSSMAASSPPNPMDHQGSGPTETTSGWRSGFSRSSVSIASRLRPSPMRCGMSRCWTGATRSPRILSPVRWDGEPRLQLLIARGFGAIAERLPRAGRREPPDRDGGARPAPGLQGGHHAGPRGGAGHVQILCARHPRREVVCRSASIDRQQGLLPRTERESSCLRSARCTRSPRPRSNG